MSIAYALAVVLSVVSITESTSITAWGTFLALILMGVSAWPDVKDSIWPSGLDHVAATQLSLACHGWKNAYIFGVCPELGGNLSEREGDNIWEKILNGSHHENTESNWERFQPLFVQETIRTQKRLDLVLSRYSDVLPSELRVLTQDAMSQLSLSELGYSLARQNPSKQGLFAQFEQVIHVLSRLERPAHDLQVRTKTNQ